jgi:drug/metabolite transporter (DMT)-like permease
MPMLFRVQTLLRQRRADAAMSLIVIVWGVHYIVVKDAIAHLPPLTFNALRFSLGLPVLGVAAWRNRAALRVAREDLPRLLVLGLIGPFGYQIFFILGLGRTTSTNTALLTATMPTWTALLTILLGIVMIRRQMITGVIMSLLGVALVILGRSGAALSLSPDDLTGSALVLGGAMVAAFYNIFVKPLIDRYGGTVIAVWTYCLTAAGLIVVSAPDLLTLTARDLPPRLWPHLLYSGLLSSAMGFLVENYAIRAIGPARTASYYNFIPLIAAAAGVLVLGDSLSAALVTGGALTLSGVLVVRKNTYLRLPARADRAPAPRPEPAALTSPAADS